MATTTTTPTTLPTPPFFKVPNINNLRDPALYPLHTPHGPIRPTLLFRSAEVAKLTLPDWQRLHALGIAHVFDLRSAPEVAKGWSGIIGDNAAQSGTTADVRPGWIEAMEQAGVKRSWVPVFKEQDYSPEGLAKRYVKYMDEEVKGFVEAYEDILRSGGGAYRTILDYLIGLDVTTAGDDVAKGALIHCTAGKDRTGIFFGILFDFLGVERRVIAEEYNLTELGLLHVRDEIVARLMLSPAFKNYIAAQARGRPLSSEEIAKIIQDEKEKEARGITLANGDEKGSVEGEEVSEEAKEKGRQAALRMVGAKKESMLGALEMVDREFGGSERYLREWCGLGDEHLEKLRRNLVVKE